MQHLSCRKAWELCWEHFPAFWFTVTRTYFWRKWMKSVWEMELNSSFLGSLSTFRPNRFSHCVFGCPHTHTHVAPAASQRDEDFRFFYFLWTLNAASRLPQIHSRTVTPTHSAANSTAALSHMNVHRGGGNQWCFDTNICSRLGNGACRSLRGSCVLCRKQRARSCQLFSL